MNKELWDRATKLAARPYTVEVYRDEEASEDIKFLAKYPELPGCMAQGATIEETLANLSDAALDYIYSLLEDGLPVPSPTAIAVTTGGIPHTVDPSKIKWQPSTKVGATSQDIPEKAGESKERELLYSYSVRHS